MSSDQVLHITDANFQAEVMDSDKPVLLDFWAEWCAPCKMLAPTIDELANDYAGKVKVGKVDIGGDQAAAFARQFDIQAIPTVLIFSNGQVVKQFVGLQQKADLAHALDEVL